MIEFDIDMGYCTDFNKLDCVVLHDEDGEMDDMKFVPERTCHIVWNDVDDTLECDACGAAVGHMFVNYCEECGARVIKKDRLADLENW